MSLLKILNQACAGSQSLSSVSDHRQMVAHASAVANAVTGGDFVSYVNSNNEVGCGFVVATASDEATPDVTTAIILPVDGEDEELVNTKAITEIHPTEGFPAVETTQQENVDIAVSSARGTTSLQTILDYYKRIYARSPKFYQMFASRLKAHAFI
jgi:predicted lysophospholipase L1 biosynthesis ABC-type transport system permease subunit